MQIAALVAELLEAQTPIDLVPSVVVTATGPVSQAAALLGVRVSLIYFAIPNFTEKYACFLSIPSCGLF